MQAFSRLANITTGGDTLPTSKDPVIEDRSVDEFRPVRVVVIGSGVSGILTSIKFRQRIPNLDICVYEKNEDIGGTWFENRYPGCACGMLFTFHLFVLAFSCHSDHEKTYLHTHTKPLSSPTKPGPNFTHQLLKFFNIGRVSHTSSGV